MLNHGSVAAAVQAIHDAAAAAALPQEAEVALMEVEGAVANEPDGNEGEDAGDQDGMIFFPGEEAKEAYDRWLAVADNKISSCVELIVRPANGSMDTMTTLMINSKTFRHEAPEGQHHLHIYDGKTEGESKTQPALRVPNNRPAYMAAAVGAALRARCKQFHASQQDTDALKIEQRSLFMFFDAFKHDNLSVFDKCFNLPGRKLTRSKKLLYISYEESTLLRRTRLRCHDSLELDVVEHAMIISESALELKPRKRLLMENSTNRFNHLGPVTLEDGAFLDVQVICLAASQLQILNPEYQS